MTATFTVEQRRAINATMTSVVRATQAKHGIDADRFRRDLAAEFDACVRTSGIDLGPLWQRLTSSHKADKLYGLFVAFDSALSPLGVHVSLPADVLRLSKVARAAFVREYLAGAQLQVPRPPGHDEWLSTHLTPLPMKVDLRVLRALPKNTSEAPMPAATRQRLAEGIAWAFKESDLGGSINSGQVAALVVQNFDRLNDGGVFNLAVLAEVISSTTHAAQAQLYIPLRRIQNLLPVFGLKPAEIRLQIDQITIQRLEAA